MHSPDMTPGNETKMKDKSVLQVQSSNLVLQGTKTLAVQVCECNSSAGVRSGPPSLVLTAPNLAFRIHFWMQ